MEQQEFAIYFEIDDMAVDENGNPAPAGMKLSFGDVKDLPSYDELTKNIDMEALVAILPFPTTFREQLHTGKVKIITPERYMEEYGDDDDEEECDETDSD